MLLLVPCDVLRPRRPDSHFAAQASATGSVALIDHDALAAGGDAAAAVARVPETDDAVYRGWMLSSGQYATMASALSDRGATLRTSAAQYRQAHELPGWYSALEAVTPHSVWTVGDSREEFSRAAASLGSGAAVLRDYTKSMKHYWHEAAYIPDVSDAAAAWRVANRMRDLRGDDFAGGFVLRRFETFTGPEARTWWIGGACRLVTAHPDTPGDLPDINLLGALSGAGAPDVDRPGALPGSRISGAVTGGSPVADADPTRAGLSGGVTGRDQLDLARVREAVSGLGLPFVTTDLVRDAGGRWRVVEVGDGQVSDLPAGVPAEDLIGALAA
ncbi:hypothetical protein GCM10010435_76760 [Winogradskya consettensis]|uniref:ATP-grasp domain-containing protein n=1 Tax=Winogradskya consettensis TaxID=113560 RepID=A0A919SKQ7_9ACTN|nr:ATP-grasp domain-containing protein [Actinoplanes consettensis]GIM74565.1 hypothetical protein Aco04nite_40970 [Actinoplanes consettensis]